MMLNSPLFHLYYYPCSLRKKQPFFPAKTLHSNVGKTCWQCNTADQNMIRANKRTLSLRLQARNIFLHDLMHHRKNCKKTTAPRTKKAKKRCTSEKPAHESFFRVVSLDRDDLKKCGGMQYCSVR